jgi:hypothetical protein
MVIESALRAANESRSLSLQLRKRRRSVSISIVFQDDLGGGRGRLSI